MDTHSMKDNINKEASRTHYLVIFIPSLSNLYAKISLPERSDPRIRRSLTRKPTGNKRMQGHLFPLWSVRFPMPYHIFGSLAHFWLARSRPNCPSLQSVMFGCMVPFLVKQTIMQVWNVFGGWRQWRMFGELWSP
jgi:hypothetical protein